VSSDPDRCEVQRGTSSRAPLRQHVYSPVPGKLVPADPSQREKSWAGPGLGNAFRFFDITERRGLTVGSAEVHGDARAPEDELSSLPGRGTRLIDELLGR